MLSLIEFLGNFFKKKWGKKHLREKREEKLIKDLVAVKRSQKLLEKKITQLNILQLIDHHPSEHKIILDELKYYINVLQGNGWLFYEAEKWAKTQNIDISYLMGFSSKKVMEKGADLYEQM